jgi:large subunit ribosomal protein L22
MAQAIARKRHQQGSPVKMRLVLDQIRGKKVQEALSIMHFMTNRASNVAEQTLRSALANFQLKDENRSVDVEELYVTECFSDGGAILKRMLPAPMGRAYRMRKRTNHLTIVVSNRPKQVKTRKTVAKAAPKVEAPAAPKAEAKTASKTKAKAKTNTKKSA